MQDLLSGGPRALDIDVAVATICIFLVGWKDTQCTRKRQTASLANEEAFRVKRDGGSAHNESRMKRSSTPTYKSYFLLSESSRSPVRPMLSKLYRKMAITAMDLASGGIVTSQYHPPWIAPRLKPYALFVGITGCNEPIVSSLAWHRDPTTDCRRSHHRPERQPNTMSGSTQHQIEVSSA